MLVGMLASEDARVQVVGGGVVVAFTAVASQLLASDGVIALAALAFLCFITLLASFGVSFESSCFCKDSSLFFSSSVFSSFIVTS